MWPAGCQSWVSRTCSKRAASALMGATMSLPPVTASAPPMGPVGNSIAGQKSGWRSMTRSASVDWRRIAGLYGMPRIG
jgi:hypothetical protein